MKQTKQLVDALRKALRAHGMTYDDVAKALDLSEASIKRVFSQGTFTLQRFEEICALLGLSIYDLARMTRITTADSTARLTLKQEQALAADQILLSVFYLLLNGWSPGRISTRYQLDKPRQTQILAQLDRLSLIELLPQNRVKLLTERNVEWRRGGPVRRLYERLVKEEFLRSSFSKENERLSFASAELSSASIEIMARKIERLTQEFNELAELDLGLSHEKKIGIGLMSAQRPWTFWSILAKAGGS